jgi:hypothetical protein
VLKLEDLRTGFVVEGLACNGPVKIKAVHQLGDRGYEVVYLDHEGNLVSNFYLSNQQPEITLIWSGRPLLDEPR